jgi:hypothetical protein
MQRSIRASRDGATHRGGGEEIAGDRFEHLEGWEDYMVLVDKLGSKLALLL